MIVLAVVAVAAVMYLAGRRLPVEHTATRSITIPAPPAAVFALITDVSAAPSWRGDVKRVTLLPDANGRNRYTENEGGDAITYEVVESVAPSRRVTRIVGEGLPFGGTWTIAIEPRSVSSPMFRVISRYLIGHTRTIDGYLTNLAKKFE